MSEPQSFQSSFQLLPEDLDSVIDKGGAFTLIKHDRTTTVGILNGRAFGFGQDMLIKRFNSRGLLDFAFRSLFFSRARRLWKINQRLSERGLPVPRPVCYFRPSFRRKNSYFISSLIEDSRSLADIYKRGLFREPEKLAVVLGKTISAWHMAGAVHGDLKWSNIMLQSNADQINIFFIDLDQAKLYSAPRIRGIEKDLSRFYRYGLELGAEEWVKSEFFPAYKKMLPDAIKNRVDLVRVKEKALKKWGKKRRLTII
jgi:tRNA A-37 threonylcarbamoyl transferase component Bud32